MRLLGVDFRLLFENLQLLAEHFCCERFQGCPVQDRVFAPFRSPAVPAKRFPPGLFRRQGASAYTAAGENVSGFEVRRAASWRYRP